MTGSVRDPLAGIAVYTLFRGEQSQLLQWCNFHLNEGADRLYVMLDCPPAELVSALPTDPRIRWDVMDQRTWDSLYPPKSQNVERKQVDGLWSTALRAAADGHNYLAFVDADELISLSQPFAEMADRFRDASALTLPVREMWYARSDNRTEPFGATLAVRAPGARRVNVSRAFGWRAQFLRNGLLGHDAGKSVYRLPMAEGEITVHRPRTGRLAALTVDLPHDSAEILHFDSGSVATWNAKWGARLQGDTVASGLGPQRLAQQQLFSHWLHQPPRDQESFFQEFFSLDEDAQRLLADEGLLERVDVRKMISSPLPPDTATDTSLVQLPAADRVDYQFALVCDKRFVKPTFATMTTVLAQTGQQGSTRFVVLGDGLDRNDVLHLKSLEHTDFDVRVIVHDIKADLDRDIGTEDVKRATFGRIYLVDYLPEQRTIYLDGDVLATRSFTELFELDLGGACLAGVPDSAALRLVANPAGVPVEQRNRLIGITDGDPLEYLNGGVLVFDLENPDFRSLALHSRALVVMQGRALKQRDQDAMNIAFAGRKFHLDSTYNYMTQFYVSDRCLDGDLMRRKYDAADATLVHFSGKIKPWESLEDEFYNGLYRRLVTNAERRVGVSCGFYFSTPAPRARHQWAADRWAQVLGSRAGEPGNREPVADIEVVDLSDEGVYLTVSADMYELASARDLRLAARVLDTTLFEVSFDGLTPPRAHLATQVKQGIRMLPCDLARALAICDGVARHVELVVTDPASEGDTGFVRPIAVVDVVAAGASATPHLLDELGADGALEALVDGWLSGWYRPRVEGADEPVSLYIDGELAALRPPEHPRPDLGDGGRIRGFRFNVERLLRLGYGGTSRAVSVRVAGTNIPLRGAPLVVSDPSRNLRFDPARDRWVKAALQRPSVERAARRGWSTAVRRSRGLMSKEK
ncbi:MAG: glycosyltransferase family 2 protein [Nocardioides sp.]|nr:glycosyltransferase family 2 protein [Nocardioides sp.]